MLRRAPAFLAVLAGLWGLWEGYKAIWEAAGFTWPFQVDDRRMPHLHDIVAELFEAPQERGEFLIVILGKFALFTAQEAAAGFALGATAGFLLAVLFVHSGLLQRWPEALEPRPHR